MQLMYSVVLPYAHNIVVASQKLSVLNFVGDVPRVDGQLAVARAFGDKSLKRHLSSDPDVAIELMDNDVDLIILASDGLWKVSCSLKIRAKISQGGCCIRSC